MAQRVRNLLKHSGSKLSVAHGSVKHIGTTPYRFRIDVFVSGVERVTNAPQVSVTWERKGKKYATQARQVLNGKAEIGQSLAMECTLFRNTPKPSKGEPSSANDASELNFDEKLAKFVLRKGGPDGKPIGKITLDLAKYIKGTTSTVFADLNLSNGSTVITKIEATMLHIGRKGKNGSRAGSDTLSEMTDVYRDDDSIFGDTVSEDLGDLEQVTRTPPSLGAVQIPSASSPVSTPTSADSPQKTASRQKSSTFLGVLPKRQESLAADSLKSFDSATDIPKKEKSKRVKGNDNMKESPSLRDKLKSKLRDRKAAAKKPKDDDSSEGKAKPPSTKGIPTPSKREKEKPAVPPELISEVKELKAHVNALKKENLKLKSAFKNAQEEIDALKADLEARELDLEDEKSRSSRSPKPTALPELSNRKDKRIAELEANNENLLEELEELHQQQVLTSNQDAASANQTKEMRKRIEELEIALKREPRFLDVVNELKVTKVSLALANMEKEQALFKLQAMQHKLGMITPY
ncbi:hypothetical protein BWQ96_04133 [Gracilariopsis chorda]|uniref:C2 NT-type domain-containing protein n=1 Tax=Gracilariopsis chorda TaxID=448386 RepID=A0A2V3IWQ7_9FLOR|nr:hypothetical protein BWQ96_04133 [Gracilariopsis chorda]|eukprot:PXF46127.1 hypothetical protein BWQ96_04133 [Gracilariopsis chorda]